MCRRKPLARASRCGRASAPDGSGGRRPKSQSDLVGQWVQAITAAKADEKDWRKDAERAVKAFRGTQTTARNLTFSTRTRRFCALRSIIRRLSPTRRRYGDQDKAGKTAADIIERALSCHAGPVRFRSARQALGLRHGGAWPRRCAPAL